jgi:DNA recombination protein RmuC
MMTEIFTYLLIAVIFTLIGLFIGKLLSKLNFEKENTATEKEKSALEERLILLQQSKEITENNFIASQVALKEKQQEKENLITTNTRQDAEIHNLKQKLVENKGEVEKLNEKFTKEFENLATRILDENSTKFKNQNKNSIIINQIKTLI